MCLKNSKPLMCHKAFAEIPDICEHMEPKCPMEPGRVYTYNYLYQTPNISVRGVPVYKLYDEKCNMIACVELVGEIRSSNKNISQLTEMDDSQPCKD
ncbi:unnamed protein product [Dicrocoelium dendriticum]|nr:unnamed protein product [Dicrocoelium dendriticum]